MTLQWFPEVYWVWRLPAGSTGPEDAFCVMRTPDETTVVSLAKALGDATCSGPWRMFRIADELPHDAVGIMARLSGVLAEAGVPILPFGSYDTDYVLVPGERDAAAREALEAAGYIW